MGSAGPLQEKTETSEPHRLHAEARKTSTENGVEKKRKAAVGHGSKRLTLSHEVLVLLGGRGHRPQTRRP